MYRGYKNKTKWTLKIDQLRIKGRSPSDNRVYIDASEWDFERKLEQDAIAYGDHCVNTLTGKRIGLCLRGEYLALRDEGAAMAHLKPHVA